MDGALGTAATPVKDASAAATPGSDQKLKRPSSASGTSGDAAPDPEALSKLREYVQSIGGQLPEGWRAESRTRAGVCCTATSAEPGAGDRYSCTGATWL
jgi:hypothetical protein